MSATRSDFSFGEPHPIPVLPQILVAEYDSGDEFLLRHALQRAGIGSQAEYVSDGWEVVSFLQQLHQDQLPALMLLDLNMPGLDGFAVLEWLQYRPELRPGYVVAFSLSALASDIARAGSLGVDHYLVKPRDPAELVAAVKRMKPYWAEQRHVCVSVQILADQRRLAEAF